MKQVAFTNQAPSFYIRVAWKDQEEWEELRGSAALLKAELRCATRPGEADLIMPLRVMEFFRLAHTRITDFTTYNEEMEKRKKKEEKTSTETGLAAIVISPYGVNNGEFNCNSLLKKQLRTGMKTFDAIILRCPEHMNIFSLCDCLGDMSDWTEKLEYIFVEPEGCYGYCQANILDFTRICMAFDPIASSTIPTVSPITKDEWELCTTMRYVDFVNCVVFGHVDPTGALPAYGSTIIIDGTLRAINDDLPRSEKTFFASQMRNKGHAIGLAPGQYAIVRCAGAGAGTYPGMPVKVTNRVQGKHHIVPLGAKEGFVPILVDLKTNNQYTLHPLTYISLFNIKMIGRPMFDCDVIFFSNGDEEGLHLVRHLVFPKYKVTVVHE